MAMNIDHFHTHDNNRRFRLNENNDVLIARDAFEAMIAELDELRKHALEFELAKARIKELEAEKAKRKMKPIKFKNGVINTGKIRISKDGNIILQFEKYYHIIDGDTELCYASQVKEKIKELKEQLRWHKTSEKLPEDGKLVLAYSKEHVYDLLSIEEKSDGTKYWLECSKYDECDYGLNCFEYWQNLPEQPENLT